MMAYTAAKGLRICLFHIGILWKPRIVFLTFYIQVVTKPMDLTTVKARLDNNYYSELTQCVADIQQVRLFCTELEWNLNHAFISGLD